MLYAITSCFKVDRHTSKIVPLKYMDIIGITSEVEGMMSATSNMNTVMAKRLVITNVMRSPDSGGR